MYLSRDGERYFRAQSPVGALREVTWYPSVVLALLALALGAALMSAPLVLASAEEGTWAQEQARHPAGHRRQRVQPPDAALRRFADRRVAIEETADGILLREPD